jgi:hypothetical protein
MKPTGARAVAKVFGWRADDPMQPSGGLWKGDWSSAEKLTPMENIQIEQSDAISFHNYGGPEEFEKRVRWLQAFRRPILCTEYMARGNGSTFQGTLPIAKKYKVAAYNWGFVAGRTQTNLPWDSWQKPYTEGEPAVWFHDIFRKDGTPYKCYGERGKVELIRETIVGEDQRQAKAARRESQTAVAPQFRAARCRRGNSLLTPGTEKAFEGLPCGTAPPPPEQRRQIFGCLEAPEVSDRWFSRAKVRGSVRAAAEHGEFIAHEKVGRRMIHGALPPVNARHGRHPRTQAKEVNTARICSTNAATFTRGSPWPSVSIGSGPR